MTLTEAIKFVDKVFPEFKDEVITPEGLVRRIYDAVCIREKQDFKEAPVFRVYGDGVLLGESIFSPTNAWLDASRNLPDSFLEPFRVYNDYFVREDHEKETRSGVVGTPS